MIIIKIIQELEIRIILAIDKQKVWRCDFLTTVVRYIQLLEVDSDGGVLWSTCVF